MVSHHLFISLSLDIFALLLSTTLSGVSHLDTGTANLYRFSCILQFLGCSIQCTFSVHSVYVVPVLHLAPLCYVLNCLRGFFAQPTPEVVSGVVDPSFYGSCAQILFLCCQDQCNCCLSDQSFLYNGCFRFLVVDPFLIWFLLPDTFT